MLSPRSRTWRRAAACAPLLTVVVALSACGGGGSMSGAGTGGAAGASTSMGGSGPEVVATETEYKIVLSTTSLQPGPTTFVAENKGRVAHSLEIDGPGVAHQRIAGTVAPGSSMQLHVTLQKGTYEIFCPVDGHRGLGMDLHVTVGGAAAPSSGTTSTTSSGGGGGY